MTPGLRRLSNRWIRMAACAVFALVFARTFASPIFGGAKQPGGAYVIDFSPINKAQGAIDCTIVVKAQTVAGEHKEASLGSRGTGSPNLGRVHAGTIKRTFALAQWDVRRLSDNKLLIIGKNGSGVAKLDSDAKGLPQGSQPIVSKANADDLKPPVPLDALATLEFKDVDGAKGFRRMFLHLEPREGEASVSSITFGDNKTTGRELAAHFRDVLITNWEVRSEGSRLTILSHDGKNGPVSLKSIGVSFAGEMPAEFLPTIIGTDNVRVDRGKNDGRDKKVADGGGKS